MAIKVGVPARIWHRIYWPPKRWAEFLQRAALQDRRRQVDPDETPARTAVRPGRMRRGCAI